LTCNSNRSICRKCYGWHLSYSRIVDLGEAVGIIAAQSIGEPGTQLTMRTFHTGGVFSGDLTRQIRAPFLGTIVYELKHPETILVRTMHGEKGFRLNASVDLYVENLRGTRCHLQIPEGNILLVSNYQKVYFGQIIAEIKKETNLILEQGSKNIYTEVSGEIFFQNIDIAQTFDKQGSITEIAKKAGIVWVLNGENASLPKTSLVNIEIGHNILPAENIADQNIFNKQFGIVKLDSSTGTSSVKILNFSLMLKNSQVTSKEKENHLLTLKSHDVNKKFELSVKNKDYLTDGQIIATLKENSYTTKTGGIVCYDTAGKIANKKRKNSNKVFSGTLYWIPEETHILNSAISENLKVKFDKIIEAGTELWSGSFSKIGGLVCFDEVTKELVIKSGELFSVDFLSKEEFLPGVFVKPGKKIFKNIYAQKLSFIEVIEIKNTFYLLVRPVTIFKVPREKGFFLEYLFFPSIAKRGLKLRTIKRIFFRNWERVKSNTSVDLLQTFLVLDVRNKCPSLQAQVELITINSNCHLKVSLYEVFQTAKPSLKGIKENVNASTSYLINDNQFVYPKTVIAQINIFAKHAGNLISIKENANTSKDLLVLKEKDLEYISWSSDQEKLLVSVGQLVRVGSPLTNKNKSLESGQIYSITNTKIAIRLGRPYLVSNGTVLRVKSGVMVQRSDMLATLVYDKLKTVDIIQGLPKVEEILEARKIKNSCLLSPCEGHVYLRNSKIEIITLDNKVKTFPVTSKTQTIFINGEFIRAGSPVTDGPISPHEMLTVLFTYYQNILSIDEACKISFKYLQLFLVNEVQKTYLSQGVKISDKHIELIVKQMTSKVRVEESGDTTLLPGEVISLLQANIITKTTCFAGGKSAFYVPILLGLTKASLSSDSFISAASFQETTRVLTEAAIEGKKDWLNGLKENVIIGQLIPAGTGFNCYKHLRKINSKDQNINSILTSKTESVKENVLKYRIKN
jgi:DNA-directed RNA polymerase subunit beta'